jgi:hypothetical protein
MTGSGAGDGARTRAPSLEGSCASHYTTPARKTDYRFAGTTLERGSQDSNLESPVLETGALANLATAPAIEC